MAKATMNVKTLGGIWKDLQIVVPVTKRDVSSSTSQSRMSPSGVTPARFPTSDSLTPVL